MSTNTMKEEVKVGKGYVLSIIQWLVIIGLALGITGCKKEQEAPAGIAPAAQESQADLAKTPASVKAPDTDVKSPGPAGEEKKVVTEEAADADRQMVSTAGHQGLPSEIRLQSPLWDNHTRGAVTLTHEKHVEEYKIACDSCHHVYQEGKNIWKQGDSVKKCVSCHDPIEAQGNVIKLQSAFHKNCRDCHREMSQEGREAPYRKCTDCHG